MQKFIIEEPTDDFMDFLLENNFDFKAIDFKTIEVENYVPNSYRGIIGLKSNLI